jgi:hypothetical protein
VAYFFKYCSGVEAEGMVVDSISRARANFDAASLHCFDDLYLAIAQ